MDKDLEKIDEYTLALLYLVTHERQEGCGARVWKGFDWETLDRLHDKGYLSQPRSKSKSLAMSEEGYRRAKALFERHFTRKAPVIALSETSMPPKLTARAQKLWNAIPESDQQVFLNNVWCSNCRGNSSLVLHSGKTSGGDLVLFGTCKRCGGEVARVIESA